MRPDLIKILPDLLDATRRAGGAIMEVYASDFEVITKDDQSPVTLADKKSENIIKSAIISLCPDIPFVGEEGVEDGDIPKIDGRGFFIVDPLDGTKEFVRRNGAFTVNIGFIDGNYPIFGIVYAPVMDTLYYGGEGMGENGESAAFKIENFSKTAGQNAVRVPISTCHLRDDNTRIVASRSHLNEETQAWIRHYPDAKIVNTGSSLKICLVAEGEADLYPRLGPTMEWDTAAGQAVLEAAGGAMLDVNGSRFSYRKEDFRNGYFFVKGDKDYPMPLA